MKWSKFVKCFVKYTGLDMPLDFEREPIYMALKATLDCGSNAADPAITMEAFSDALAWFGPLKKDSGFAERILQHWMTVPGFVGFMTLKEAELELSSPKVKDNSFLIRFSSTKGCFVVSCKPKKKDTSATKFVHFKIQYDHRVGFQFDDKTFETIDACLKVLAKKSCKYPHPGRFTQLLEQSKANPDQASVYKQTAN